MAEPFIGEIRMFCGNYAPVGWALCNGQILPIAANQVLFALLGNTYGGDGSTTFGVPDFRGRIPVAQGPGYPMGRKAGSENVTLTPAQLPSHNHVPQGNSTAGTANTPQGNVWAASATQIYSNAAPANPLSAQSLQASGGGQAHNNVMPYQAVSFIIALEGLFPSQN